MKQSARGRKALIMIANMAALYPKKEEQDELVTKTIDALRDLGVCEEKLVEAATIIYERIETLEMAGGNSVSGELH